MVTAWRKSSLLNIIWFSLLLFFLLFSRVGFVFEPTSYLWNISKYWNGCLVGRNEGRGGKWKGDRSEENLRKKEYQSQFYLFESIRNHLYFYFYFSFLSVLLPPFLSSPLLSFHVFQIEHASRWRRQDAVRKACYFNAKQSVMI